MSCKVIRNLIERVYWRTVAFGFIAWRRLRRACERFCLTLFHRIPCLSGFRQAFPSIPTTLQSSFGLPAIAGASNCKNMSEVHKPTELRGRDLDMGPICPTWSFEEGPSPGSNKPSMNCVSSRTFSMLKLTWTDRPISTQTSTAIFNIYISSYVIGIHPIEKSNLGHMAKIIEGD